MNQERAVIEAEIARVLESELNASVVDWQPVSGGDIGTSARVELACGRALFVKRYATPTRVDSGDSASKPPPSAAIAEAAGLRWLALAEAIHVPSAVAVREDWIALDWIERARPSPDFDERLGRELARLHGAAPDALGLETDNWIGSLPQSNRRVGPDVTRPAEVDDWAAFYADRRVAPLARRASEVGAISHAVREKLERVCTEMSRFVGPEEPPARLHGDLWSGNLLCDERGAPCLIDPAVYGGHREVDLAMMRLFGGFSERVFDAYDEAFPLSSGWRERVALYQLYPLLVHCCLFGSTYASSLEEALAAVRRI